MIVIRIETTIYFVNMLDHFGNWLYENVNGLWPFFPPI